MASTRTNLPTEQKSTDRVVAILKMVSLMLVLSGAFLSAMYGISVLIG